MKFTQSELREETDRLHSQLKEVGWTVEECALHAPLTLEIRELARRQEAVILAHSYQTPDIVYGIADYRGDSLGLAAEARDTDARTIVFCGVRFMAETAKILSPEKRVLLPAVDAGCSLSEAITGEDVRRLRAAHPGVPVVCYVNTSADVKAECDLCVTSANAVDLVEALPGDAVVFLPDRHMAANLRQMTSKRIIDWDGICIVHDRFNEDVARAWREMHPEAKMLVHTECTPAVVGIADLAGGTGDMIRFIRASDAHEFMLVTECGLSDRMRVEFPDRRFIGTCALCPHMKRVDLAKVLEAPRPDQVIEIPEETRVRALRAVERMFELTAAGKTD